jgi:DNA replication protein DnaC
MEVYTFGNFSVEACAPISGVGRDVAIQRMRAIYEDMCVYARNPIGWRILSGSHGAGKTHLAAAAVRHQVLSANRSAYIGTAPDMLDMLRTGYQTNSFDALFERLRGVQLLAIDDLGTQNATAWTVEKLYQIINYRLENRLPLIVTTNEDLRKGSDPIDGRILSRLLSGVDAKPQGWSVYHVFPVADYRPRVRVKVLTD